LLKRIDHVAIGVADVTAAPPPGILSKRLAEGER